MASEASSVVVVTPASGSEKGSDDVVNVTKEEVVESTEKADEANSEEKADGAEDKENDEDKDKDEEEDEEEKFIIGMIADRKDLYQKMDLHNRFTWTEKYPDDIEEAAENEETVKYAILVRNKKSYDSRKKLEIDSIVIQSPLIKNALREVLKDYPGVVTSLARLTFAAPFRPFVHRWEQFTAALDGDYDEDTKKHLKVLYDVLAEELKDVIAAARDYVKNKVATYEHIWTLFVPGSTVFASRYGKPVATKLKEGQFIEHPKFGPCFSLKCDRVEFDGSKFGYDTSQHIILPFLGTVPIVDLDCFPLQFHEDPEGVSASLIARGRIFEKLAGYHYKAYKGQAIEQKEYGPAKITVESRIVVDAHAHGRALPNLISNLKPLHRVETNTNIHAEDDEDHYRYRDPYSEFDNDFIRDNEIFVEGDKKLATLSEDQLLHCSPIVKGYALKTKKWLEFFVDCVTEVTFNEQAFDSLVLPEDHKSLILAFAQNQIKHKETFDDVISGKGKGIIMLLSGGPGIGKTLTAESVAENMRVPLYIMSAGDLGTASWEVENKLTEVLEMVAKWNAVLLLDECDVFLEARTSSDLDRNRIVSIFLRTLEYYEGILFLTTNRVQNIDEAFHSRIHISLEYPPLDEQARRAVWAGFLNRAGETSHELTEEHVDRLAKLDINGRVIKNALKTSNLLAYHRGQPLKFEHLRTVLKIEGHKLE